VLGQKPSVAVVAIAPLPGGGGSWPPSTSDRLPVAAHGEEPAAIRRRGRSAPPSVRSSPAATATPSSRRCASCRPRPARRARGRRPGADRRWALRRAFCRRCRGHSGQQVETGSARGSSRVGRAVRDTEAMRRQLNPPTLSSRERAVSGACSAVPGNGATTDRRPFKAARRNHPPPARRSLGRKAAQKPARSPLRERRRIQGRAASPRVSRPARPTRLGTGAQRPVSTWLAGMARASVREGRGSAGPSSSAPGRRPRARRAGSRCSSRSDARTASQSPPRRPPRRAVPIGRGDDRRRLLAGAATGSRSSRRRPDPPPQERGDRRRPPRALAQHVDVLDRA